MVPARPAFAGNTLLFFASEGKKLDFNLIDIRNVFVNHKKNKSIMHKMKL